tara:strand:- start:16644 stop:18767 length:2124 start_codon:yes stop_codon:yes gene_type:complete
MAETREEQAARIAAAVENDRTTATASPTQGEPASGWRNSLGNIVEGTISPLGPLLDKADRGETSIDGFANLLIGATKGGQFGGTGLINAIGETANNFISGVETDQTFRERWQADADQVNRHGSVAGEVIGSVASAFGGPVRAAADAGKRLAANVVAKPLPALAGTLASRSVAGTLGRASAEAAAAAGGGFAYSMLEGNEPSAASTDAMLAFGFGGAGKLTAEIVGTLFRTIGVVPAGEAAASDVISKLRRTDHGAGFLTDESGQFILDERKIADAMIAGDETLLDIFPDNLLSEFTRVVNSGEDSVQIALRPFRSYLDSAAKAGTTEFKEVVDGVLSADQLRNPNQFTVASRESRRALQPQYDEALAFENINKDMITAYGTAQRVDGTNLVRMAQEYLGPSTNASSDAREVLKRLTARFERKQFTPAELLTLRNDIDTLVYRGSMNSFEGFEALSAVDKGLVRNALIPFRQSYNEMLYDIAPNLRGLDSAHASTHAMENAYEAGSQLFVGKNTQGNAWEAFMDGSQVRTVEEQAAFTEGLKNQLFFRLENATPAKAAKMLANRGLRQNITAVVGEDGLQQLEVAAALQLHRNDLGKALGGRTPASSGTPTERAFRTILDAAVVGSTAVGLTGTGIGMSAGRRGLTGMSPSTGISQSAEQASSLAAMGSSPADVGSDLVNTALRSARPVSIDDLALGALRPLSSGRGE